MEKLKNYFTLEGWKRDLKKTKLDTLVDLVKYGIVISTAPTILLFSGNPIYHLSGFVASLAAVIIDNVSTMPAIKLMNTPEFKENGLDRLYREENPIIGEHPTIEQYKIRRLKTTFLAIIGSAMIPPVGFGYLAVVPFIAKHNKRNTEDLRRDLGNEVER